MNRLKSNNQNLHGIPKKRDWKKNWQTLKKSKLFITLINNISIVFMLLILFI
jgi:hypothetical protein